MASLRPTERLLRHLSSDPEERVALNGRFNTSLLASLRSLTLILSLLYLAFLGGHAYFFPSSATRFLIISDLSTAVFLFLVYLTLARGSPRPSLAHPLGMLVALVILLTDVITFALAPHALIALNWILVEIGVGSFSLSLGWFAAFSFISAASWIASSLRWGGSDIAWATGGVGVAAAILLSAAIQVSRLLTIGKLELSSLRLRRLSDAALEGVGILEGWRLVGANSRLAAILGEDASRLIGQSLDEFIAPAELDAAGSGPRETAACRRSGTSVPIEISRKIITSGPPALSVIAIRDLTGQKQAEKTIRQQQLQIIQSAKMTALGEMASGVSHEINNPLSAMLARIELLQQLVRNRQAPQETILNYLAQLYSDGRRINRIVAGLQIFARDAESDEFESCDLRRIVDESVAMIAEKFSRHGIRLVVEPIPSGIPIECRPTQISQILVNLLSNAHDAVENLGDRWVEVAVTDLGEHTELSVTDSGHGIPAELREKILQPFFTTKGPRRGTGLGLSISKGLAEAHHGALELDRSSSNTRFVVTLPKSQAKWRRQAA